MSFLAILKFLFFAASGGFAFRSFVEVNHASPAAKIAAVIFFLLSGGIVIANFMQDGASKKEMEFWTFCKEHPSRESCSIYLKEYPDGEYKKLAELELKQFSSEVESSTADNEKSSESWIEPVTGMEFVWIKPGCFNMGSPESEPEHQSDEKQHPVCIKQGFYLGKYEVTQAQWKIIMHDKNPADFKGDNLPIENVPVVAKKKADPDVQTFIKRLNAKSGFQFSLPTEAQWEYAARAGTATPFYTGNCITTEQANYDGSYDYNECGAKTGVHLQQTVAVGSYPANGFGLHDMAGNAREWTCSEYDENYLGSEQCASENHQETLMVSRGGAWLSGPLGLRSATRLWSTSDYHIGGVGFRLMRVQ